MAFKATTASHGAASDARIWRWGARAVPDGAAHRQHLSARRDSLSGTAFSPPTAPPASSRWWARSRTRPCASQTI